MNITEYAHNYEEYLTYDLNTDTTGLSEEEFIEKLISNSFSKRVIYVKNNDLINENLVPYEKDISLVTEEIAEQLEQWVKSLHNAKTAAWMDRAVPERIQKVLYKVYVAGGQYDKAAKALYFLTYFDIIHREHYTEFTSSEYAGYCDEWAERFDDLSYMGKEFLMGYFFMLCFDVSNMKQAFRRFLFAKSFYDRLDDDLKNNENVKRHFRSGLVDTIGITGDVFIEEKDAFTEEDMECIREIFRLYESTGDLETTINPTYVNRSRRRMNFHLGDISLEELLNQNKKSVEESKIDSNTGIHLDALVGGADYIQYLWEYSDCSDEEKYRKSNEIIDKVFALCGNVNQSEDNIQSVTQLAILVNTAARYLGYSKFKNDVVDITVRADKALYIHTVMVYLISAEIAKEIVKTTPEYFDGVGGFTTEEIKCDPDRFLDLVKECAFLHDIGKHCCMDYVSDSSRSITDREFHAIKFHPQNFESFFMKEDGTDAWYSCVRDCAVLHHVWFNNEGGYPDRKHTENKPMVAIISIADSLDAATDVIGRPYTSGKTLDTLIDEFDTFRDTRYSSFVTDIIKRPELKQKIKAIITDERCHVNYDVYSGRIKDRTFGRL